MRETQDPGSVGSSNGGRDSEPADPAESHNNNNNNNNSNHDTATTNISSNNTGAVVVSSNRGSSAASSHGYQRGSGGLHRSSTETSMGGPRALSGSGLHRTSTENSVGMIPDSGEEGPKQGPRITPYERLSHDLSQDQRVIKEITLGRRIAFYRIRGEIGTGNFSQVKLGIHALTKEKVAIKILDKTKLDQKTQRLLSREITSMERLHHPNIIRLYEVVETLAKLHIIMEYAGGGELFTKISNEGRLPEIDAKCIFAQLVSAIEHMHSNNIIHRDLKAENVFYSGPKWIKVGDFGFSTVARTTETLNTFCGSPPYAAPELFKDEHYYGTYVDIWAMGILLYFMVTGLMPFRAETVAKLKKCILDGSYTVPSYVSDSCVFLIRSILKHIPQDRFTLPEIKRSEWLECQEFPGPLEPYNLNPSADISSINPEEREARGILSNLGIQEEHFKQASIRDSRSSITGTYRIVLHRVQKKNSGLQEVMSLPDLGDRDYNLKERRARRTTPVNHIGSSKPQSRTCTVL